MFVAIGEVAVWDGALLDGCGRFGEGGTEAEDAAALDACDESRRSFLLEDLPPRPP